MGTALGSTIAADALALVLDLLHGEAIRRRGAIERLAGDATGPPPSWHMRFEWAVSVVAL
jgi:hypothetical protein